MGGIHIPLILAILRGDTRVCRCVSMLPLYTVKRSGDTHLAAEARTVAKAPVKPVQAPLTKPGGCAPWLWKHELAAPRPELRKAPLLSTLTAARASSGVPADAREKPHCRVFETKKEVVYAITKDVSRHRETLAAKQKFVDLYTMQAILPADVENGALYQVDHVFETQIVATALMHAWQGRVPDYMMNFAKRGLNPEDLSNYILTRSAINNSKGKLFTAWLSKCGATALAPHMFGLASEQLQSSSKVCKPYLPAIAGALDRCGSQVVAYYNEHGVKGAVGSSGARLATATQALLDAFQLGDILDGQTAVRVTRAAADRTRQIFAIGRAGAGAGAGAGASAGRAVVSTNKELIAALQEVKSPIETHVSAPTIVVKKTEPGRGVHSDVYSGADSDSDSDSDSGSDTNTLDIGLDSMMPPLMLPPRALSVARTRVSSTTPAPPRPRVPPPPSSPPAKVYFWHDTEHASSRKSEPHIEERSVQMHKEVTRRVSDAALEKVRLAREAVQARAKAFAEHLSRS